MTKAVERKTELIWMAWSPDAGYLPQAASVDKWVCWEMVRERKWVHDINAIRVIRVQVGPPPKRIRQ